MLGKTGLEKWEVAPYFYFVVNCYHISFQTMLTILLSWFVGDVIMSMFMNELYGFQLDNHRWCDPLSIFNAALCNLIFVKVNIVNIVMYQLFVAVFLGYSFYGCIWPLQYYCYFLAHTNTNIWLDISMNSDHC